MSNLSRQQLTQSSILQCWSLLSPYFSLTSIKFSMFSFETFDFASTSTHSRLAIYPSLGVNDRIWYSVSDPPTSPYFSASHGSTIVISLTLEESDVGSKFNLTYIKGKNNKICYFIANILLIKNLAPPQEKIGEKKKVCHIRTLFKECGYTLLRQTESYIFVCFIIPKKQFLLTPRPNLSLLASLL